MEPYDSDYFPRPFWMEIDLPEYKKQGKHIRNLKLGYDFEMEDTMQEQFEIFFNDETNSIYECRRFAGMVIVSLEENSHTNIWLDENDFNDISKDWINLDNAN